MNKEAKKCPVLFIRFKKYMLIRHSEPVQILLCLNLRIVSEQNLNKLLFAYFNEFRNFARDLSFIENSF